ncbi:MAG TPA: hypothetical protein VF115_15750, partial [Acidimicrobiia bacterium]
MTPSGVEESLARAEAAVAAGESLSGTGFWSAVSTVKRHPELVERYADRIAEIDEGAFRNWVFLMIPLWLGTSIALTAFLAGVALVGWAYVIDGLGAVVSFYAGVGVLLGATHGLAHLIVGWSMGMHFTCWFVAKISQPQPGVKIDYSTYLRTAPRKRAWMHASGALATKVIPFLLIGAALAADLPHWAVWLLP